MPPLTSTKVAQLALVGAMAVLAVLPLVTAPAAAAAAAAAMPRAHATAQTNSTGARRHAAAGPSILFVMADDLGWQDLGFREVAPGVPTDLAGASPYIDSLVAEGVQLSALYVSPVCSPTRAQLMTGQYALRLGFPGVITPLTTRGHLPLDVPMLAEGMRDAGYATAMTGKWHVGFANYAALPTSRGWQKAFNFYGGGMDYWSKVASAPDVGDNLFLDIHAMGAPDRTPRHLSQDFYSGALWQERAEQIITEHAEQRPEGQPLFLYYAMQSPHSPMQVPQQYLALQPCAQVLDTNRQIMCGMVHFVDECVKKTTQLMATLLDPDLLLIFMSDNGGNPGYGGFNMPLRGRKATLFEGGVRSSSFIWGRDLPTAARGSTYDGLMHVTDMLPTLLSVATAGSWKPAAGQTLDGVDQYAALVSGGAVPSPRMSAVLIYNAADRGTALRWDTVGDVSQGEAGHKYKLILNHPTRQALWYPPPGASARHRRMQGGGEAHGGSNCTGAGADERCAWLFDLAVDADERTNLYEARAAVVADMVGMLQAYAPFEVTCEQAQTCGPADPAGFEAFESEGYFVPWIGVPPTPPPRVDESSFRAGHKQHVASKAHPSVVRFHQPYEVGVDADGSRYGDHHYILHAPPNDDGTGTSTSSSSSDGTSTSDGAVVFTVRSNGAAPPPVTPTAAAYDPCRTKLDSSFCNNISIPSVAAVHKETVARNQTLPLYSGMWSPASWGVNGPATPWHCYSGSVLTSDRSQLLPSPAGGAIATSGMTIPLDMVRRVGSECPIQLANPTNFTMAWSSANDGLGRVWQSRIVQGVHPPFFGLYHQNANEGKAREGNVRMGSVAHDVGEAAGGTHTWGAPLQNISSEDSSWANYYTAVRGTGPSNNVTVVHEKRTGVDLHYKSLPNPVLCAQTGVAADCFWSHSNGKLQLPSGVYFTTVAIPWICGWTGATRLSAGLFAFRSHDSLAWEFAGTIATVGDIAGTGEGPNENDAAVLPNGDIVVVMRTDGGDGTKYCGKPITPKNYYKSISSDGGFTWSKPTEMVDTNGGGIGCARPRLLSVGSVLLLSGGRVLTEDTIDIRLWTSTDGHADSWTTYSVSDQHNRLVTNLEEKLWWQVNTSDTVNSTTAYTSLLPLNDTTVLLAYDGATTGTYPGTNRTFPRNARQFYMPITVLQS